MQPLVEQETVTDGTLEVLYEDHQDGSELKFFLNTGTERIALHSARRFPRLTDGHPGARARREDERDVGAVGDHQRRDDGDLRVEHVRAAEDTRAPRQLPEQPREFPYPITTAENSCSASRTPGTWRTRSSRRRSPATSTGGSRSRSDNTVCDYSAMATHAKQAATNAGVNVSAYQRYVYAFPSNTCSWWGLGSVGGFPSHAWINGTIGAQGRGATKWDTTSASITRTRMTAAHGRRRPLHLTRLRRSVDIMGQAGNGHFTAFQKERLGWLNYGASPPITAVTSNGTYTIEPYASAGTGAKALKILERRAADLVLRRVPPRDRR